MATFNFDLDNELVTLLNYTCSLALCVYLFGTLFVTLTYICNVDLEGVQFEGQVYISVKVYRRKNTDSHSFKLNM